jgi:hypothetical protein
VRYVEIEPRPEPAPRPPTEAEREAAAERLTDAAGDGRLTLEEFSDRVGAVWGAETVEQLAQATAGIDAPPPVGSTRTVGTVVSVMGDQTRSGRWRLPARLRGWCLMGDITLDLREVVCTEPEVLITTVTLMGDLEVIVPDGVEVELGGFDLLGDRELRLAPVPRRAGTPLIRVKAYTMMGDVTVRSSGAGESVPGWRRWLLGERSPDPRPPVDRPAGELPGREFPR